MEFPKPLCGKCGEVMTPENARMRPELFLHDACLPDELRPAASIKAVPQDPLPCGCRATRDGSMFNGARAYVAHCPLHAAAPALLAVVERLAEFDWRTGDGASALYDDARTAIAKAKEQS